ncbi:lysozyme inhibitor LprI family protein [Rivularia sp. UHCC 0363]|uniref:lysozyme inhibitor LprI family protein n=1 Tax=Rivularia sp. UHCC 0363 TaxID=3110244 RepID=UPI002B1F13E1|nr:lysozyme inhibitor LprI family protein [Rivularia sp. UHCC 0363]MEA5596410.1 lysozyme inhibitor LprI family protein [Rivularia sp. UHCC 0363]
MNLRSTLQKIAFISLPILGIVAVPNLARGNSYEIAQNVNCKNPQTTSQMRICAGRSYETADQKLNQVYRQLKPKLRASQQKRLVDAQTAWIQFRDKSCAFEAGDAEGGTLEPVLKLSCLTDVTQQRVKDLQRYLEIVTNR